MSFATCSRGVSSESHPRMNLVSWQPRPSQLPKFKSILPGNLKNSISSKATLEMASVRQRTTRPRNADGLCLLYPKSSLVSHQLKRMEEAPLCPVSNVPKSQMHQKVLKIHDQVQKIRLCASLSLEEGIQIGQLLKIARRMCQVWDEFEKGSSYLETSLKLKTLTEMFKKTKETSQKTRFKNLKPTPSQSIGLDNSKEPFEDQSLNSQRKYSDFQRRIDENKLRSSSYQRKGFGFLRKGAENENQAGKTGEPSIKVKMYSVALGTVLFEMVRELGERENSFFTEEEVFREKVFGDLSDVHSQKTLKSFSSWPGNPQNTRGKASLDLNAKDSKLKGHEQSETGLESKESFGNEERQHGSIENWKFISKNNEIDSEDLRTEARMKKKPKRQRSNENEVIFGLEEEEETRRSWDKEG